MLLLVTLALVVASAVLLILGFVQDALGFIYLSMLCAGVAALALFVFARLARRRGAALAGAGIAGGTSPYLAGADHEDAHAIRIDPEPSRTRQMAPVAAAPAPIGDDDLGNDLDEPPVVVSPLPRVTTPPPAEADAWAAEGSAQDWGDEIMFPIEDYDELRVAEILPLLAQLEMDELQEVRDREVSGKARGTILDRIDDRLGRRPAGAATAPIAVLEPEPAPSPAPTRGRPPAGRAAKAAPAAKKTAGRKAAAEPTARGRKAAPRPAPAPAKATSTRKAASTAAAPARAAAKKASGAAGKAAAATTSAKKAAPAKKAAATKAATTKAAAAPAKKAASKAAPAKKATKAAAKKR